MRKQHLVLLVILVLLSCNCFLLWQIYSRTSADPFVRPDINEGPKRAIIQQLQLDEAQVDQYEALIRQHRSAVIAIDKETAGLKRTLYQSLLVPANRDSLINLIGEQQKNIERVNLAHFEDIKTLCRPEQQERFTQLVQELDQLFNHPHHPPARPGPR